MKRAGRGFTAALAAALLAGCAAPARGPAPAPVSHPGFDTWRYPGDQAMEVWRSGSPYRWVGYYLPSPCHRATTWVGKRGVLERQGWGIAVLYVGQQEFEGQPDPEAGTPADSILCSRTLLTAEQGRIDARDAVQRAEQEGFPAGATLFLNVERVERVSPAMIEYYRAWTRELLADGRYVPGTYAHRSNAAELYLIARAAHAEAGLGDDPSFWVAGGTGFTLGASPAASGLPFADVWQGALNVDRTWGGVTLRVDENVSRSPSPSAPGTSQH